MKKRKLGIYVGIFVILVFVVGVERTKLEKNIAVKKESVDEFSYTMNQFELVFQEVKCFPVVKEEEGYPVTYDNSWGAKRSYGGERVHEGCDLMANNSVRGKYKVCSMTNGVVEKIGWLEQGGWRIGIRSENGIYYYYAHLDSYEKAFKKGDMRQTVDGLINQKYLELQEERPNVSSSELRDRAKSSVKASATAFFKKRYLDAFKKDDRKKMDEIRTAMRQTGLYDHANQTAFEWEEADRKDRREKGLD